MVEVPSDSSDSEVEVVAASHAAPSTAAQPARAAHLQSLLGTLPAPAEFQLAPDDETNLDWYERGMNFLQTSAHVKPSSDVEETIPQVTAKLAIRRLPTPCANTLRKSGSTTVLGGVHTNAVTEQRTAAPSRATCTALCLDELVSKPAFSSKPCVRMQLGITAESMLEMLEPFCLQHFRHTFLDLPEVHVATRQALNGMPNWDPLRVRSPQSIHLCVDGSFIADTQQAAWAVVAFVQHDNVWHWGGYISGLLYAADHCLHVGQTVQSPHTAELVALLHALAVATQLPNTHCHIVYDATAAAGIAEGHFLSRRQKVLMQALFSLNYLARIECSALTFEHVHSHHGHAFNEAADTVAKAAAKYGRCHTPDLALFAAAVRHCQLDWLWWLTSSHVPKGVLPGLTDDGRCLVSGQDIATPCHSYDSIPGVPRLATVEPLPDSGHTRWSLSIVTYNCTTITKECDRQCLATCFQRDGLALVGLQETRTCPGPKYTQGMYVCFASSAENGNFGCQLWVNRSLSVAKATDDRHLCFDCDKACVLTAEPRLLVVVIPVGRQLIACVVAHAPLPETAPDQAEAWWSHLDQVCCKIPRTAIPIIFIDANARFDDKGNSCTAREGHPLNVNACNFRAFLEEHSFETCVSRDRQGSPIATWVSPYGKAAQLDYIAFPQALHCDSWNTTSFC